MRKPRGDIGSILGDGQIVLRPGVFVEFHAERERIDSKGTRNRLLPSLLRLVSSDDGRSLRLPGAPSHTRLVRDPHRDWVQSLILEQRGLDGISPPGLRAINEGF